MSASSGRVRAVNRAGALVLAQKPDTTAFEGRPAASSPPVWSVAPPPSDEALQRVFFLLRRQTGHDFSQYKPGTVMRRLQRRMDFQRVDSIGGYLACMQDSPAEVTALFRDLLIRLTGFFRDPEVFEVLERQILPGILDEKAPGAAVRVWSAGCSTGEEAYSIAILLAERQEALKRTFKVSVIGTDLDGEAIEIARAGRYPAGIAADISPERLERFFTKEKDGGYRINESIRKSLIFAKQDVSKDPPVSRVDLISCRNVLIYFGAALQQRIFPLFHFALNPGGVLALGTSESTGQFNDLFAQIDPKSKLYRRRDNTSRARRYELGPPKAPTADTWEPTSLSAAPATNKPSLREVVEQALLGQLNLAAALVNGQGDLSYLHGRTGRYLEPSPGEAPGGNILTMAREGLRRELTVTLRRVVLDQQRAHLSGLRVESNGEFTSVDLTITPVPTGSGAPSQEPRYLVVLQETEPAALSAATPPSAMVNEELHGKLTATG